MADAAQIRELEFWLTTPSKTNSGIDHQDGEWVIATLFRPADLLPLLDRPDCVASRRDSLIYALVVQLESLLDPHNSPEPHTAPEREQAKKALLNWAREHWQDVLRVDKEMGLSVGFDSLVMPLMPPDFQREYQRLIEVSIIADRVRRRRHRVRRVLQWSAIVVGLALVICFHRANLNDFAVYVGFALTGIGLLGLIGFKVGPLGSRTTIR